MSEQTQKPTNKILRVFKWLGIGLALTIVLIAAGVWVLFGTESGRLWALNKVVAAVNRSESVEVHIEGLQSPRLGELSFERLSLIQGNRELLNAADLTLIWHPWELIDRRIIVDDLSIGSIHIQPREVSAADEEEAELVLDSTDNQLNLEDLDLPEIQIANFDIGELRVVSVSTEEQAQALPDMRFSGELELLHQTPFHLAFEAVFMGETIGISSSDIKIDATQQGDAIYVVASLNEAIDGYIGNLIQLPENQHLDAVLNASLSRINNQVALDIENLSLPIGTRILWAEGNIQASSDLNQISVDDFQLSVDESTHRLSGTLDNRSLDFSIDLDAFPMGLLTDFDLLQFDQAALKDGVLSAEIDLSGTVDAPYFDALATLNTQLNDSPLLVSLDLEGSNESILIENLDLNWAEAELAAQGNLDLATENSAFNVQLSALDFSRLENFGVELPEGLSASLESLNGELTGNLKDPDATLSANIAGSYKGETFTAVADIDKSQSTLQLESVSLSLRDSNTTLAGSLNLDSLVADLNLNAESFSIAMAEIVGINIPTGLSGYIEGTASISGELQDPAIQANLGLQGSYEDIPYSAVANLSRAGEMIDIRSINIKTQAQDILNIQGMVDTENVDISLQANRLPTDLLSTLGFEIVPGRFYADFDIKGPITLPEIAGFLEYQTLSDRPGTDGRLAENQFGWRLEAVTTVSEESQATSDIYQFRSTFSSAGSPSGDLKIDLPAKPYMNLIRAGEDADLEDLPLNIDLDGDFDLSMVALIADPDIHRLTGSLNADLGIRGTAFSPEFNGSLNFQNTYYDNPVSGTHIEQLNCELLANQDRFEFGECMATDGNSGKFNIAGNLRLPLRGSDGDIDIEIEVNQAHVLQRPEIESQATGNIQVIGDFKALLAQGTIEIAPLEASIEASRSSGIPKIKVEKVESLADYNGSPDTAKQASPLITLNLLVTASQQAYIRGRGLEAELQGEIYLRGTAQKPRYEGEFSTIRGDLELFGKTFDLENGLVNFANDAIGLNFEAVYEEDGQSITALITGTAEDLDLSFSAVPSMAEDEILAFIIFGKSVQEISPFEAVQLASAVQQLRGGGGFDPIGSARDALGVDRLNIETETLEDDSTGFNVGIGKYLNEKVYLELERTPNPSQPWKGNLEIELTPNLNLESSTGGSTGIEGAELKWKKDY